MGSNVQDLYVICNWNQRAAEIISQLRATVLQRAGEYPPVVVVTSRKVDLEPYRTADKDPFRFVEVINGDPGSIDVLLKAGAPTAKSVLILADDENDRSDSKTLLTLMALTGAWDREFEEDWGSGRRRAEAASGPLLPGLEYAGRASLPNVVVEYMGQFGGDEMEVGGIWVPDEFEMFDRWLESNLQILCVGDIRSRVFAQAARSGKGGLVPAYNSLLSYDRKDCETYVCEVAWREEWLHFGDVVRDFLVKTADTVLPIIPVAVRSAKRLDTNPVNLEATEPGTLVELAVIAYEPPRDVPFDDYAEHLTKLGLTKEQFLRNEQCKAGQQEEVDMIRKSTGSRKDLMHEHYIICHWNDRAAEIVSELRSHESLTHTGPVEDEQDHRVPVVVLTRKSIDSSMLQDIEEEAKEKLQEEAGDLAEASRRVRRRRRADLDPKATMDVYFRPGDPVDPAELKRVNLGSAKSVVVLADEDEDEASDARTLQCLLAIKKALGKSPAKERPAGGIASLGSRTDGTPAEDNVLRHGPHIVVEIRDVNNYPKFQEFEKESGGRVEVIRAESLRTRILAQAARTPGLVEFYYDLLNHEASSNELYELNVSGLLREMKLQSKKVTYPELVGRVLDRMLENKNGDGFIPIGVWRANKVFLNPRPDSPGYRLQTGSKPEDDDSLVVIAYHPPKL